MVNEKYLLKINKQGLISPYFGVKFDSPYQRINNGELLVNFNNDETGGTGNYVSYVLLAVKPDVDITNTGKNWTPITDAVGYQNLSVYMMCEDETPEDWNNIRILICGNGTAYLVTYPKNLKNTDDLQISHVVNVEDFMKAHTLINLRYKISDVRSIANAATFYVFQNNEAKKMSYVNFWWTDNVLKMQISYSNHTPGNSLTSHGAGDVSFGPSEGITLFNTPLATEAMFNGLNNRISGVLDDLEDVDEDIEALTGRVETLESEVETGLGGLRNAFVSR